MSAETFVRMRMAIYIVCSLLWISYTVGMIVEIIRYR